MADNKEEKASFVEVIGAIAGMVASVVNPIIKDIPTPQEPPAIETPAEPSNQDFEDLIDKVAASLQGIESDFERSHTVGKML